MGVGMILQLIFFCLLHFSAFALHKDTANHQVFIERMSNGKYIVAAPLQLAKDRKAFHAKLSEKIKMPPYKDHEPQLNHDYIDYDYYPSTNQQLNIRKSADKAVLTKLKNFCLDNAPSQLEMSSKSKLQRFKLGVCSPVIVVPGILATSLIINIDCQKLKKNQNKIFFQDCSWLTCSKFGVSKPDDEYLLWVGLDLMFTITVGHTKCFGNLFGLLYNNNNTFSNYSQANNQSKESYSQEIRSQYAKGNFKFQQYYSFPSGINSTWFGNTQKSKPYSQCGVNAIRDLSGYVSTLSMLGSQCALRDYGRLLDVLMAMGYQPGLSMQPLPYDFRYGVLAGQTQKLLPQIIKNLYRATGKKVVIVAHSLGTLHTLSALAFFSKQIKQKMVRHYIPITPPWFGTVSALRNLIYGDPSYIDGQMVKSGINRYAQMKFARTSGSTFDLILRNSFQTERNESWMKQVLERIQYENQENKMRYQLNYSQQQKQKVPLNWFPAKTQKCFDSFFKKNPYCRMGFIDFKKTPIFKIKDKNYYGTQSSITQLLKDSLDQQSFKKAIQLWDQTKVANYSLNDMPAPGVNTSMIFTTLYDTQIYYEYDQFSKIADPQLDDNTFLIPKSVSKCPGDISVPSFSPLLFVAKWIHNKANGNNTINVIEYCANYKGDNNKVYSTITCECNKNPFKNQLDCTHPCIISDRYIISFVLGILTNSKQGYADDDSGMAFYLSQQQINKRVQSCLNLLPNKLLKGCPTKYLGQDGEFLVDT